MKPSRYVTIQEAAEILGLTRQMTHLLTKKGGPLRLVRKEVLHRKHVERLAARRTARHAKEQADRECRRILQEKLDAVRQEFAEQKPAP